MPAHGTIRTCLAFAVAMPIVYFGTQLVAAPFYPHYSVTQQVASMLGSPNSLKPWIFNTGAILTGITAIIGSYGVFQALRSRVGIVLNVLISLSILVVGITSFKAGLYPLPDPRHSSWQFLTVFLVVLPLLLLIAAWRMRASVVLRGYMLFSTLLLVALIPFMSRALVLPWLGQGLLQRLFAAAVFVPVGVAAYVLRSAPLRD